MQLCENCREADNHLVVTCPGILPITLYVKPSPLWDALTGYKDADRRVPDRTRDAALLKRIYTRFVAASGQRLLASLAPDLTCVVLQQRGSHLTRSVPSSRGHRDCWATRPTFSGGEMGPSGTEPSASTHTKSSNGSPAAESSCSTT